MIDLLNRIYYKWASLTSLEWTRWNARRARRLLNEGRQGRGRIVGIRVRHGGNSDASDTKYEWAVDVTPSAGESYRAGFRQHLQHADRARLNMEVPVRHDDRRRTIIDWPAMLKTWGLDSADVHEMGWKQLRSTPDEGIDDKTIRTVKGERTHATLVDVDRYELFGMTTDNFNLVLRAGGRDLLAKREYVPVYARHLVEPGTELPVGIDGDKVRVDWTAAATGQPGSALPPAAAAIKREQPVEAMTAAPAQTPQEAIAAAPLDDAIDGVGFDTWVEVSAGLVRDRVPPASHDAYAQEHGVPAGAWAGAEAAWQARMMSDWTIGARYGEAYAAALKSKRRR